MAYRIKQKRGLDKEALKFLKSKNVFSTVYTSEAQINNKFAAIILDYNCPFILMDLKVIDLTTNKHITYLELQKRLRDYMGNSLSSTQYWKIKAKL